LPSLSYVWPFFLGLSHLECHNCRRKGHIASKDCRYCKTPGHLIQDCPTRPPRLDQNKDQYHPNDSKLAFARATAANDSLESSQSTFSIPNILDLLRQFFLLVIFLPFFPPHQIILNGILNGILNFYVCRLRKAFFGLKQAPRAWFAKFHKTIT
jgi:hypothetical protein